MTNRRLLILTGAALMGCVMGEIATHDLAIGVIGGIAVFAWAVWMWERDGRDEP